MQIGVVYPRSSFAEIRPLFDGLGPRSRIWALTTGSLTITYSVRFMVVVRLTDGPYTGHDSFHDPFVMFAYLAGITERIQFAAGILILPQRQTALVARQAADLDLLSRGRLRLGVGVDWKHVEYEAPVFATMPCSSTTRGAAGSVDPAVATTGDGNALTGALPR